MAAFEISARGFRPAPPKLAGCGGGVGRKDTEIDLFAGLGGLEVALEKAGVKVLHSLMVEKDVDCRRLLRRKYPGSDFAATSPSSMRGS